MSIYKKLLEVKKEIDFFKKDADGFNYKYVDGGQVLSTVKPLFEKHGVLVYPELGENKLSHIEYEKVDRRTGEVVQVQDGIVSGFMFYNFVDIDTGETLKVRWSLYGQQSDIAQAFGSALTYAERYFYLKFLGVPTDEVDPDRTKDYDHAQVPSYSKQKKQGGKKSQSVEDITLDQAMSYQIKSGKLKGVSLSECLESSDGRSMLNWLANESNSEAMNKMAKLVLGSEERGETDEILPWE